MTGRKKTNSLKKI